MLNSSRPAARGLVDQLGERSRCAERNGYPALVGYLAGLARPHAHQDASANAKPSASRRSMTLRRMYSDAVMHLRSAARSISGLTRGGQRTISLSGKRASSVFMVIPSGLVDMKKAPAIS